MAGSVTIPHLLNPARAFRRNRFIRTWGRLAAPNINVLTGDAFGVEDEQGGFNMESLFTINEDALQNAFSIDQGALTVDVSR